MKTKNSKIILILLYFIRNLFTYIAILEAAVYINNNLGSYLMHGYVSNIAATKLTTQINNTIKEIALHAEDICKGFNVPKGSLISPIYTGYEKYYSVDKTNGEHYYLKPKF